MPFYLVSQRGIPGARLIEAEKPQGAVNHVVDDLFTVERVDGRALLDAAKQYEVEVAGAPKVDPEPTPQPEVEAQPNGAGADNGGPIAHDPYAPKVETEINYDD